MLKWVKLYKEYYLGLFILGAVAILLQELPYIIMPFIDLPTNPIMNMTESSVVLNIFEKIFGTLSMVFLVLIVRKDDKWFSVKNFWEKIFFFLAIDFITINFIGWIFYFNGYQSTPLIVVCLFAAVPLYYIAIGLWRKNFPLVICGAVFFIIHTLHGFLNFLV